MMAYLDMPVLVRSMLCTWAIVLCIGFIARTVTSTLQKRPASVAASALAFICSYSLVQVSSTISLLVTSENSWETLSSSSAFAAACIRMPGALFLALLILLSVFWAIQYHRSRHYRITHITTASIKEAADELPCGICIYREDGQPVLVNHAMNTISFALSGRGLLSGTVFADMLTRTPHYDTRESEIGNPKAVIELPRDKIFRFSRYNLKLDDESFCEIIAEDVTEFCRQTEQLRKDNERLSEQNRRMQEYGETMGDVVRREEILAAKMDIHDEMNRLLLKTEKAILSKSLEEKLRILKEWQTDILLLCIQSEDKPERNALSDLYELAHLIGVTLVFEVPANSSSSSPLSSTGHHDRLRSDAETSFDNMHDDAAYASFSHPVDIRTMRLFVNAAEEGMVNAVKHAGATHYYVTIADDGRKIMARFRNNGIPASGPISETGGLGILRKQIEEIGGNMAITTAPEFTLAIEIPKGA